MFYCLMLEVVPIGIREMVGLFYCHVQHVYMNKHLHCIVNEHCGFFPQPHISLHISQHYQSLFTFAKNITTILFWSPHRWPVDLAKECYVVNSQSIKLSKIAGSSIQLKL